MCIENILTQKKILQHDIQSVSCGVYYYYNQGKLSYYLIMDLTMEEENIVDMLITCVFNKDTFELMYFTQVSICISIHIMMHMYMNGL